jgi:CHAT domain-containing protein
VLAGKAEVPRIVELGPAKQIEKLVERLRRAIRNGVSVRDYIPVAVDLRRQVLDPILPSLMQAHLVDIVPDGDLHFVPFPALCWDSGEYLAEHGPAFHVFGTEEDLLPSRWPDPQGKGLLALGDPDFSGAVVDPSSVAHGFGEPETPLLAARSGPSFVKWPPLPQTRTEVERVALTWSSGRLAEERVDLLEGAAASEIAMRRHAAGHRVIHIATHGFYEDATRPDSRIGARGVPFGTGLDSNAAAVAREDRLPFLRSGLVFAGAEAAGSEANPENDGILTTEEVLGLDLSGVEWVVLSACDTGIGEIRGVEGVLGLRRAFRMAGARTVIGSLWPVEDLWAREWMEALYRARFVDRLSTPEAVRAASLAVLAELRLQGLETLPRRWASFVAVGDSN